MPAKFDFKLFMKLPAEVRKSIYGYVLKSDKPIRPQLCDDSFHHMEAKFHDSNNNAHDATFKLTHLTRASKKLRKESLPVFYSANSFDVDKDTTTYLTWLKGADRFDLVRRINLKIPYHRKEYTAFVLWMVSGYDKDVSKYEKGKCYNDRTKKYFSKIPRLLREHPRYQSGGWPDLAMRVVFRMLSTSLETSTGSDCKRKLVLPVSNVSAFETDSKLRWLSKVTRGLGIELRLVEQPGSATLNNGRVYLQWNRKYQKTDVATLAGSDAGSSKEVMRRAKEQFPDIERFSRPRGCAFHRQPCFERQGGFTWYDIPTIGGGYF